MSEAWTDAQRAETLRRHVNVVDADRLDVLDAIARAIELLEREADNQLTGRYYTSLNRQMTVGELKALRGEQ